MRTLLTYKRLKLNNNKLLENVLQSVFVYIFLLHHFIICHVYQHGCNTAIINGESVSLKYPYVFGSNFLEKNFNHSKHRPATVTCSSWTVFEKEPVIFFKFLTHLRSLFVPAMCVFTYM